MKIQFDADEVRGIVEEHVRIAMNMWTVSEVELHKGGGATVTVPNSQEGEEDEVAPISE